MTWCPQCDEAFPEGPACPRCGSPLVELGDAPRGPELQQAVNLPQLRVPRKLRRAFDRMNRPAAPPRPLFAFTMAFLLFAGGFAVGRMGSLGPDGPVIRPLRVDPFPAEVSGSVEFVGWAPGVLREPGLVRLDLASGELETVARFTWPFGSGSTGRERTKVVARDRDVAVVVSDGERQSFVGAAPASRPSLPFWLDGLEAAWDSSGGLVVFEREGVVRRWTFDPSPEAEAIPGAWTRLVPSSAGAVLEGVEDGRRFLALAAPEGLRPTIDIPAGVRVVAVSSDGARALLDGDGGPSLWDGSEQVQIRSMDPYQVVAASFSPGGRRVALTLYERGRPDRASRLLAVVDASGSAALKPVHTRGGGHTCSAVPSWDPSERWAFLAPGDGWIYGVEVSGARATGVNARVIGCGITWIG